MIRVNGHILWLGDIQAAEGYDWLKNNNIRTGTLHVNSVITVGTGFNISYDASIQHYKYSISDSKHENIGQYFDDAVKKITRGMRSLYCRFGEGIGVGALWSRCFKSNITYTIYSLPLLLLPILLTLK